MPSDERERQFERALRRQLRGASPGAACPAAETLAAYHEHTLSLEEMTRWKEHVGGCIRCQEILSLVESTNEIAAHDWEEQDRLNGKVLRNMAHIPKAMLELREEAFDQNEERSPGPTMMAGPLMAATKNVRGRGLWKWAAPLGALAAGLLVFWVVRESKVNTPQGTVEVARNRETAAPMEKQRALPQAPKQETSAPARIDSPTLARKSETQQKPDTPPVVDRQAPARDYGYPAGVTEPQLNANSDVGTPRRAESKPSSPEITRAQEQTGAELDDAKNQAVSVATAPQPSERPAAGAVAAPKVSGEKKDNGTASDKTTAFGTISETGVNKESRSATKSLQYSTNAGALRKIAAADPRMILAPDGNHAWRLGSSGAIEATTDGGKSWQLQTSGILSQLKSGSSPTEDVCWIVGKVGTILLTIDGGKHWKQVSSPLREDLGGVHAVDARHASVWNVPNNKSFETADGGATWTPAANE